ncbi:DUF6290 family protein (plasmid) [Cetobacterium somerae]|uniref:type II toxin-antitoxin system RelB family antitoxin n=1 Tax=Cetobacterium somerae TaxID=188913 RepID=UPI002E7AC873|nr:DUF6290 family protein [Cetobacterium somerae]WVJ03337.1 DUF6290 family protein [Cetobacterium somerae]
MSVISVRLNDEEETLLKKVADFEGMGLSSYIKKIVFERLEEEYDLKLAKNIYIKFIQNLIKKHTLLKV